MSKNLDFYRFGSKVKKSGSVRKSVSWQFSLGMHLFRQAERETLRVRQSRVKGCDVRERNDQIVKTPLRGKRRLRFSLRMKG